MDKIKETLGNVSKTKLCLVLLAVIIVIVAIVLAVVLNAKKSKQPIEETTVPTTETTTVEQTTETTTEKEDLTIVLDATSVEKDIRIRFYNSNWKLRTGIKYEVDVKDSKGNEKHYVDEDMDGKIDLKDVVSGKATVTMAKVEGYTIENTSVTVNVKEKVEYKAVKHVEAEVVHDGKEDTKKAEDKNVLKDTVAYVESTKTEIKNYFTVAFKEVVNPEPETASVTEPTTDMTEVLPINTEVETTTEEATTEIQVLKDKSGNELYMKNGNDYVLAYSTDYSENTQFYRLVITYKYTGWQNINGKMYYYKKDGNFVTGNQVIQGVKYNFSATGARGGTIGIDVSSYQGNIDWKKVKNEGINFAIIRVGYRGYGPEGVMRADDYFDKNIQGAIAEGIKVGIYYFSQAITEPEAVLEASYCIEKAAQYKLDLPIFIDTESAGDSSCQGRANSLSAAKRTAICKAFCETVKDAGYKAGIYANKYYFEKMLETSKLETYTIWLAEWNGADVPSYRGKYDLWQTTSGGKVDGISGRVDMNKS